jgi:hypothetical protein
MITVIIVAVVVYAAFHLGAGHTHHRYRKAHGLGLSLHARPSWRAAPASRISFI